MKYRQKPVVVDAIQFTGKNLSEVLNFVKATEKEKAWAETYNELEPKRLAVLLSFGFVQVDRGDWIIKGIKGEVYTRRDDIFELSYEEVVK